MNFEIEPSYGTGVRKHIDHIYKRFHHRCFPSIRYLPPLTKLAAQTEFSQLEKDCSGSSKDGHGLKFER